VAGKAAIRGMDLTGADEGRGRGAVAAGTVFSHRGERTVLHDRSAVVVVMTNKISGMTLGAGAALAAVVSGVAVTVGAIDAGAVDA